jgi:hypothetical protein
LQNVSWGNELLLIAVKTSFPPVIFNSKGPRLLLMS